MKEILKENNVRIACVSTVKNEEDLILHNIKYHSYIGVTDFFVFLDHSSDKTKDRIRTVPNLCFFEDLEYQDLLRYNIDKLELDLELIKRHFSTHSTLRQVFHANMALEICRDERIDWLIHLDPDELVCIDKTRIAKDSLKSFFSNLDTSVEAVSFRNIEVVPTKIEVNFAFEDHLFKSHSVDGIITGLPKSRLFNPFTNSYTPSGWFWGHSSGKVAIRPFRNSYFTSSHQCHTEREAISTEHLLHFNIYSYKQFLNKYRNFANYPNRQRARPPRLLLRDIVNCDSFSEEFLIAYYKKHIMYSEEDIEQIRRLDKNAFHEIHSVSDFFFQRQNRTG